MSWYLCGILLSYASPHSSPMESSSQLRLRDILLDWHLRRVTQKSYTHKKDWGTNTDCCSVTESYLTVVTHGLQHTRICHPSLSLGVHSNSCPLSQLCHPTNSSSAVLFSCSQSFLASGIFFQWVTSSKNLKYTEQLNVMQNPTLDAGNGNRALLESWWNASMFCMLVNSIIPRSVS